MRKLHIPSTARAARQRGLTLIEFMVSIAIGMILVAALATLIADQSSNRAEVDRAGRLIESGRYAARAIADDLQMAGYWGEISTPPTGPAAWTDPCGAIPAQPTAAEMVDLMGLHVTGFEVAAAAATGGYNDPALVLPAGTLACLPNLKAGTDVVVVRHADPDSTAYENGAGVPDVAKLTANANRLFMQAGLNSATGLFAWKADTGANAAASFTYTRKDKVTLATVRKVVTRMYYVTTCSVCTGTPDTIPSLKMKELVDGAAAGKLAWSDAVTISEGIENLQVEYGVDTVANQDGAPDGADVAGSTLGVGDWPGVVTAKLYLLVRSIDRTPGYTDTKTYPLGLAGTVAAANDNFKRHVFVQSVRLVNPAFRRSL
jgi:type IV pilus assembly protein PilW